MLGAAVDIPQELSLVGKRRLLQHPPPTGLFICGLGCPPCCAIPPRGECHQGKHLPHRRGKENSPKGRSSAPFQWSKCSFLEHLGQVSKPFSFLPECSGRSHGARSSPLLLGGWLQLSPPPLHLGGLRLGPPAQSGWRGCWSDSPSCSSSALWSWTGNRPPSAVFGDPGMTGEMPSQSGYGSRWCLGEGGGKFSHQKHPEGNSAGHVIADDAWGHTMPCSILMLLLRHGFPGSSSASLPGHGSFPGGERPGLCSDSPSEGTGQSPAGPVTPLGLLVGPSLG